MPWVCARRILQVVNIDVRSATRPPHTAHASYVKIWNLAHEQHLQKQSGWICKNILQNLLGTFVCIPLEPNAYLWSQQHQSVVPKQQISTLRLPWKRSLSHPLKSLPGGFGKWFLQICLRFFANGVGYLQNPVWKICKSDPEFAKSTCLQPLHNYKPEVRTIPTHTRTGLP